MKALNRKGEIIEVDENKFAWESREVIAKSVANLLISKYPDLGDKSRIEISLISRFTDVPQRLDKIREVLREITNDNFFKLRFAALKRAEEEKERLDALANALDISAEEIQVHDRLPRESKTQSDYDYLDA